MRSLTIVLSTMRAAFAEATALRASFFTQIGLMAANDVVFVLYWIFLFRRVGTIRGWDLEDMMMLFAIITTAVGISMGLFANSRRLGEMIADGALDAVLTIPIHPLPYLLVRRVNPLALGDTAFGVILLASVVRPTLEQCVIFAVVTSLGAAIFTSFLVCLSTLTFFTGGRGQHVDSGFNAFVMLCMYPIDIFNGAMKVLLFTALPVALVSSVPSRIVQRADFSALAILAVFTLVTVISARVFFDFGLKRYSSGSLWTRA